MWGFRKEDISMKDMGHVEHFAASHVLRGMNQHAAKAKRYFVENEGSMKALVSWMDEASASLWFVPIVLLLTWPSGLPATVADAKFSVVVFIVATVLYVLAVLFRIVSYERDGYTWVTALKDAGFSSLLLVPHLLVGLILGKLEFVPGGFDDVFILTTDCLGVMFVITFVVLARRKEKPLPTKKLTRLAPKISREPETPSA